MALQSQINRFIDPPGPPIRVTGTLDPVTAGHATGLMFNRSLQGFLANREDREAARQLAAVPVANPMPYVEKNLDQIVAVLRDFGDYQGKPPAKVQGSPVDTRVLLVAGALGLGALLIFGGRGRSRR